MSRELELSKRFVLSILRNGAETTTSGLNDIIRINSGDNYVLHEHMKAIVSIMGIAIKELESELAPSQPQESDSNE